MRKCDKAEEEAVEGKGRSGLDDSLRSYLCLGGTGKMHEIT